MASLSFGRTKLRLLSTFMLALGLVVQPFSTIQVNAAYVAPTTATVCAVECDYTTLQDAVNGVAAGGVVTLMEDVTLGSQVTITKPLTIDGDNSYGITTAFAKTDNSNNAAIGIIGTSGVTIHNLYITDDAPATSQLHGVNVYESTDVSLNNLSIFNMGRYAVVVNSSSVAIDSIYTENNGWGGINVDQTTLPAEVTMTGDNEHNETFPRPGLYTEGTGATLTDNTLGHQYTPGIFPGTYSAAPNVQGPVMNYDSGESFTTIQAAIDDANTLSGHTIEVDSGTYTENVVVNKAISLVGMGAGTTTIVATNANATPLSFATNDALVSGFTLTHQYTGPEISAWSFNNNGVTFHQFTSGNTLEYSTVTMSRNGIYMNNASANLRYNDITNNRTGLNTTNNISGTQLVGNSIFDNWTVGWVYYESGMSTDFSTVSVIGNFFGDNWYSEIVIKDAPLSTGTIDVSSNGFFDNPVTRSTASAGTTSPSIDEPGYTVQVPNVVGIGGPNGRPGHSIPTLRIYNSASISLAYVAPSGPQSGGPATGGSGGGSTSGTSTASSSNAGRGSNFFGTTTYDDSWMEGANTEEGETFGEVLSGGAAVSGTSTTDGEAQEVPAGGISWYWWLLGGVLAAGAWSLISLLRSGRFSR